MFFGAFPNFKSVYDLKKKKKKQSENINIKMPGVKLCLWLHILTRSSRFLGNEPDGDDGMCE